MTGYLIDTHILLWWLTDDKKLPKKVKALIVNPEKRIVVSAVTMWEMAIKKSLGKLAFPDNLREVLEEHNFTFLSMTVDHALAVEYLPLEHNDPFDRLLIAQCIVDDLVFVTEDGIIKKYPVTHF